VEHEIRIDTPESVDLALEPAGLGSRFLAALIDGLIEGAFVLLIVLAGIPTLFMTGGEDSLFGEVMIISLLALAVALLFFLYKLLLEAFWNGQTVGKRVAGIRVVQANGLPVTFLAVVIRNLLRVVDILPGYYVVGAICVLATQKRQRLGDMAAGSIVVRERPAGAPLLPVHLTHNPQTDLNRLREHALRLNEEDLAPARSYWQRRHEMEFTARERVAAQIAVGLAHRMNWQEPLPTHAEDFIEEVLHVRAQ
jgi:uncharacterized RDD family membrane protein YckC